MMSFNPVRDRRNSPRYPVGFEVLVSFETDEILVMQAVNKSETGLYVLSEGFKRPRLGKIVEVVLNQSSNGQLNPKLKMLVTRMDKNGIGLEYIKASQDLS